MAIIIAAATKLVGRDGFSDNIDGTRNIREIWSIKVNDGVQYDVDDLLNATDLPKKGEIYEETKSHVVTVDLDPQRDNDRQWIATVLYAPLQIDLAQVASDEVAKNRLLSLRFDTNVYTETIDSAYFVQTLKKGDTVTPPVFTGVNETDNDEPTDNTAGDKIIGITEPFRTRVMFLTQIEKDGFNPDKAQDLVGYPNLLPITIAGTKFAAMEGIITKLSPELKNPSAEAEGFPEGKYWVSQYQIERKKGGWFTRVINDGYRKKVTGVKSDIINSDVNIVKNPNDKVSEPQKLNTTGNVETGDDVYYRLIWAKFPKKWANIIEFVTER